MVTKISNQLVGAMAWTPTWHLWKLKAKKPVAAVRVSQCMLSGGVCSLRTECIMQRMHVWVHHCGDKSGVRQVAYGRLYSCGAHSMHCDGVTRPWSARLRGGQAHAVKCAPAQRAACACIDLTCGSDGAATWPQAACHTVTAVVGAGVLGLPYSFSYLGWAVGLIFLIIASSSSLYTSYQLASLHEQDGKRINRYRDLGVHTFGPLWGRLAITPFQTLVMVRCSAHVTSSL